MLVHLLPEREREEVTELLLPEREMEEVTELAEAAREEEPLQEVLGGVRGGEPHIAGSVVIESDCLEERGNLGGEPLSPSVVSEPPMGPCLGEGAMTSLMLREMARFTSLGQVEFIAFTSSASIAVSPLTPLIARRRSPGKSARDLWLSSSVRMA